MRSRRPWVRSRCRIRQSAAIDKSYPRLVPNRTRWALRFLKQWSRSGLLAKKRTQRLGSDVVCIKAGTEGRQMGKPGRYWIGWRLLGEGAKTTGLAGLTSGERARSGSRARTDVIRDGDILGRSPSTFKQLLLISTSLSASPTIPPQWPPHQLSWARQMTPPNKSSMASSPNSSSQMTASSRSSRSSSTTLLSVWESTITLWL